MLKQLIRPAPSDTTRDRILKAAILRFSTHSYEETGLRLIASDVGVDMAYVHRCFGSKEKLFYEAVIAVIKPERVFVGDPEDLPSNLSSEILVEKGADEINPIDILVRSFSSPGASRVLRELIEEDLIKPLCDRCPKVSRKQAALIAAFLAGVGIMKDVIQAEELQEGPGGTLEHLISNVIVSILNANRDDDEAIIGTQPEHGWLR